MRLPGIRHSSLRTGLLVLAVVGLALVGCRQVATGSLHVANDLSGIGRDNTFLRAYAPDPGDVWPPTGQVNILVKGDDFGSPPSYGMNGYLYLVRTSALCPQSEGAPEVFTLSAVTITGIITVTAGSVNQFVTMADTPANRAATWALIDVGEFPSTGGGHLIRRCGPVIWTP
ncbi:MAG: hypothetical protein ACYDEB_14385 [Dehalococcoidia bacterium]